MRILALVSFGIAGCSLLFEPGTDEQFNSATDSGLSTDADPACILTGFPSVDACTIPMPTETRVIDSPGIVFNTDLGTFNDPSLNVSATVRLDQIDPDTHTRGPTLQVLSLLSLQIDAGYVLRIEGLLPLLIYVDGEVNIAGALDASTHLTNGPGANYTECAAIATRQGTGTAAGAGGGAYGGISGAGGSSFDNTGGSGGAPMAVPKMLRGGCPGGRGADGTLKNGAGGGAMAIVSTGVIVVSGTIDASGGGGDGAGVHKGGSGGGSGGMLWLSAPMVSVDGLLSAIGGGGGGGGGDFVKTGTDGKSGSVIAFPTSFGQGGFGGDEDESGAGGNGGSGGYSSVQSASAGGMGAGSSDIAGGGGGGGSEGAIVVISPELSITGQLRPDFLSF